MAIISQVNLEQLIEDAAPGSKIILEGVTYRLNRPLVITKPISIVGERLIGKKISIETIIESDTDGAVILFEGDGPFQLERLNIFHIGNRAADVILVKKGCLNMSRCDINGGRKSAENHNTSLGCGIRFKGKSTGKIGHCICFGNDVHGISIEGEADPNIYGIMCAKNGEAGISYTDKSSGTAEDNSLSGSRYGISLNKEAHPTLLKNLCHTNSDSGMIYLGHSRGIARSNSSIENKFSGICLSEDSKPILIGNRCQKNVVGLFFKDRSKGLARKNTCEINSKHGILISMKARPILRHNECSNNNFNGIKYTGESAGVAAINTCNWSKFGISLGDKATPTLVGNTCLSNDRFGIACNGNSGGIITGNFIIENKSYGIYLGKDTTQNVDQNFFKWNVRGDILDKR